MLFTKLCSFFLLGLACAQDLIQSPPQVPAHEISSYARDNVEICKSRPFAPTQLNYRRSGSDVWLREYTLENREREYFKHHGLAATIAYDFLGDTNFKCAIGTQSSCTVHCLNVVGHIEDLELARRVYFVLASTGHFVASLDIIHNAMQAAQGNVGLMAGRMSYVFFWFQHSADELQRIAAFNQLSEISLWAAQSALNAVMPLIPWGSMKDWVFAKISEKQGRPISNEPGIVDMFPTPADEEISEIQLTRYTVNNGYLPDAPYTLRVPPRFGGPLWWNPDGVSLANWWYNNGKLDGRLNKQEFYGKWEWNAMARHDPAKAAEVGDVEYQHGWFPDFRARWNVHGFTEAASHAWSDFKDLCAGTAYGWRRFVHGIWPSAEARKIQEGELDGYGQADVQTVTRKTWAENQDGERDWMARVAAGENIPEDERRQQPEGRPQPGQLSYITHLRAKDKLNPPTKLGEGDRIASWGPTTEREALGRFEGWDSYDEYRLEQIAKTWPIPDEPEKIWIKESSDETKIPNRTLGFYQVAQRTAGVGRILFPIVTQGLVKTMVNSFFSKWKADDKPREINEMGMQWWIQESGRISRMALKETVNRVIRSESTKDDGSSELADILALGTYLPATDGVLGAWTASEVETTLTKNIFYKTLNMAINTQKIFISCTSEFRSPKGRSSIPFTSPNPVKDFEVVKTCAEDTTGPQHSKACIDNVAVCYLYRWNDRGIIMTHTVEDPFGFNDLAADPWNLKTADIISSSFWSHVMGLKDVQLASNLSILNDGPTVQQAADPQTPGLFTVPICLSSYNWNSPTTKDGLLDDLNVNGPRKAIPCYCGNLGKDTTSVWQAMGITGTVATKEYVKTVCPAQIGVKMRDWLERYVAYCRLGIRKGALGIVKTGKDGMCDLVIHELESKHIISTMDLEPEQSIAFKCKIKGSKKKKCKPYAKTPISSVWDDTIEAVRERKERERSTT
ncbi:hypothetical protein DFP73DRAFT_537127 [Morchella snyderi]|nr:hypothetical protein DFP73DRAFT_537127 [Morchella snyderi]